MWYNKCGFTTEKIDNHNLPSILVKIFRHIEVTYCLWEFDCSVTPVQLRRCFLFFFTHTYIVYLAIHSILPPFVGDIISSVLCKIVWKSAKKSDKLADIDIGTFTVTKEASPVRR